MNSMALFNPRFAADLFDAMDQSMGGFFPALAETAAKCSAVPAVDVRELKDKYLMEMDLPGFSEADVELSLKDRVLTISSIKTAKETKKEEKADGEYLLRERTSKVFMRRFTLPNDIDEEKVNASFKNGVLAISIPRKEAKEKRTIAITSDNA